MSSRSSACPQNPPMLIQRRRRRFNACRVLVLNTPLAWRLPQRVSDVDVVGVGGDQKLERADPVGRGGQVDGGVALGVAAAHLRAVAAQKHADFIAPALPGRRDIKNKHHDRDQTGPLDVPVGRMLVQMSGGGGRGGGEDSRSVGCLLSITALRGAVRRGAVLNVGAVDVRTLSHQHLHHLHVPVRRGQVQRRVPGPYASRGGCHLKNI
jgi:hypothetical protein